MCDHGQDVRSGDIRVRDREALEVGLCLDPYPVLAYGQSTRSRLQAVVGRLTVAKRRVRIELDLCISTQDANPNASTSATDLYSHSHSGSGPHNRFYPTISVGFMLSNDGRFDSHRCRLKSQETDF